MMKKIKYKNSVTLLIVLASLVCILICLIDLNNYFHDSDRLMKVYEVLEKCNDENDYDDILATVSPDNVPSKRNFIAEGFVVKDTKTKYAGLKRDLMLKQLQ